MNRFASANRLCRLRNVRLIAKGCADHEGSARFQVPVQESGALSTGQAHLDGRADSHPGAELQVGWESSTTVSADVVEIDQAFGFKTVQVSAGG